MADNGDEGLPILFFFPEIIGVAACVLFSPIWSMRLVHRGHYLSALSVLLVAITGAFGFWRCMVSRRRLAAFLIMVAILLSFLALNALLPQTEGFMNQPVF